MVGDISSYRFLPLACVINFTKNGQNDPFKVPQPYANLLSHTHLISVFPIKSFSSSFMVTLGFYSIGYNMSSSILLSPFFGINVKEILTPQPFHHFTFIEFMLRLKPQLTWSPNRISISACYNFSKVPFIIPIFIIDFLASSMQPLGTRILLKSSKFDPLFHKQIQE